MPSKKDPATEFAEKLVATLEAQRSQGSEFYPLPLEWLVDLTDSQAPPELIAMAIGKKAFKARAVLTSTTNPAALVVLAEDIEQLAASPRLLESTLETLCTSANPLCTFAQIKAAIQNPKLRKAFADAILRQIRDNTLPPTVGYQGKPDKPQLFLKRIPPRNPEEILADKLLQVLKAQRDLGGEAYPLALKRLVELTEPGAKKALQKKALAHLNLQGKLAIVDVKKNEAVVALAEDRDQLLSSAALLESILRARRSTTAHGFPAESLVAKKSDLYQPFMEALERRIETGALPTTIGWLWIGKKKYVFLLEDVHRAEQKSAAIAAPEAVPAPPQPHETAVDFANAFDAAFNQLNRQQGSHNFVSLVELRRALSLPPEEFDTELRKLRVAGRYTLSAADDRDGASSEAQAAGIVEDGSLLLFVSQKTP